MIRSGPRSAQLLARESPAPRGRGKTAWPFGLGTGLARAGLARERAGRLTLRETVARFRSRQVRSSGPTRFTGGRGRGPDKGIGRVGLPIQTDPFGSFLAAWVFTFTGALARACICADTAGQMTGTSTALFRSARTSRGPAQAFTRFSGFRGPCFRGGHERLFQGDGSVPGGQVVEVWHVNFEILLDQLVAERDSERLQPRACFVIRPDPVRADQE